MAKPALLITGVSGQLGHEFMSQLSAPTSAWHPIPLTRQTADLSQPESLEAAIQNALQQAAGNGPALVPVGIINCAAYTAVDKAQSEAATAAAVNTQAPQVLAQVAQRLNIPLVHFSTDYVFDGSKPLHETYAETDATHPTSVYGQTKCEGEAAVRAAQPQHLILRTSWVVGAHGGNFLKTMLRLAAERDALRVVADQHGAPTSTALLVQATLHALQQMQGATAADPRWGTYHLVAKGHTTWHGYAQHVVAGASARGAKLKVDANAIAPITTAEYPLPAPRPANSRLSTAKFEANFHCPLPDWQHGVDEILNQLYPGTP